MLPLWVYKICASVRANCGVWPRAQLVLLSLVVCFGVFIGAITAAESLQTFSAGVSSTNLPENTAADIASVPHDATFLTRRGSDLFWVTRTREPIAIPKMEKSAEPNATSTPAAGVSPTPQAKAGEAASAATDTAAPTATQPEIKPNNKSDNIPNIKTEDTAKSDSDSTLKRKKKNSSLAATQAATSDSSQDASQGEVAASKRDVKSRSKKSAKDSKSKKSSSGKSTVHGKASKKEALKSGKKDDLKKLNHNSKKKKPQPTPAPTPTPPPSPTPTPVPTHLVDHIWLRATVGGPDTELLQTLATDELKSLQISVSPEGSRIVYLQHMNGGGVTLAALEKQTRAILILLDPQTTLSEDQLTLLGWTADGTGFWTSLSATGRVRLARVDVPLKIDVAGASNSGSTALGEVKWKFIDPAFGNGSLDRDKGWVLESSHAPFRVLDFATLMKVTIPLSDAANAADGSSVESEVPPREATWKFGDEIEFMQGDQKFTIAKDTIVKRLNESIKKQSLLPESTAAKPALSGDEDLELPRAPAFDRVPGKNLPLFVTALHFAQLSNAGLTTSASGVQHEVEEFLPRRHLNEAIKACAALKLPSSQNLCLLTVTQISTGRARIANDKISWLLRSPADSNYLTEFCQSPSENDGIRIYRACLFDPDSLLNFAFAPATKEVLSDAAKKAWFCTAAAESRDMVSTEFSQFVLKTCGKKSNSDIGVSDGPCTNKLFSQDITDSGNRENEAEALCRLFSPQSSNQGMAAGYVSRATKPVNFEALHRYLLSYYPLDEESARDVVRALIHWNDKEIVRVLTALLQQTSSETARRVAIAGFGELRDGRTLPILEAYAKSVYGDRQIIDDLVQTISRLPGAISKSTSAHPSAQSAGKSAGQSASQPSGDSSSRVPRPSSETSANASQSPSPSKSN